MVLFYLKWMIGQIDCEKCLVFVFIYWLWFNSIFIFPIFAGFSVGAGEKAPWYACDHVCTAQFAHWKAEDQNVLHAALFSTNISPLYAIQTKNFSQWYYFRRLFHACMFPNSKISPTALFSTHIFIHVFSQIKKFRLRRFIWRHRYPNHNHWKEK